MLVREHSTNAHDRASFLGETFLVLSAAMRTSLGPTMAMVAQDQATAGQNYRHGSGAWFRSNLTGLLLALASPLPPWRSRLAMSRR